jgi:hypothetical protein
MSWRSVLYCALVLAALWQAREQWLLRPTHPSDGVLAPLEPIQRELDSSSMVQRGRWQLSERASYDITARILGREDYHFDAVADLIPEDLALGWGPMSDNRVLRHFVISQGVRFYTWQSHGELPIPRAEVVEHSANTHVIPSSETVRQQLSRLRVGQVVHLVGELVDGKRDDGASIHTSLTRKDEGPGSCEVMLVEEVELIDPAGNG